MSVQQSHYEKLLADYSNHGDAIALLKQYRPYLEMIPSMRRSDESVITVPLPIVRVRCAASQNLQSGIVSPSRQAVRLPCDVAILMCDPEWQIKTGVEICIFIHRPDEDFSNMLGRWRQTQVLLDNGYEWMLPLCYSHILNEGEGKIYPLFVVFESTLERIKRGLKGANLPFVIETPEAVVVEDFVETLSPGSSST